MTTVMAVAAFASDVGTITTSISADRGGVEIGVFGSIVTDHTITIADLESRGISLGGTATALNALAVTDIKAGLAYIDALTFSQANGPAQAATAMQADFDGGTFLLGTSVAVTGNAIATSQASFNSFF